MDAEPLAQFHPGAALIQTTLDQIPPLLVQARQLLPQPAAHRFLRVGVRRFGATLVVADHANAPRFQAAGIGQQILQAGRPTLRTGVHRSFEAAGPADRPQGLHFEQLFLGTGQLASQVAAIEGGLPPLAPSLLQLSGPLAQLPELARNSDRRLAIAQFLKQRPAHVGHGEAAEADAPLRIEGLYSPDQSQAGHLHQVVVTAALRLGQPCRDAAGQGQIGGDQGVAPTQAAAGPLAALQLPQQPGIALAGDFEGRSGDGANHLGIGGLPTG